MLSAGTDPNESAGAAFEYLDRLGRLLLGSRSSSLPWESVQG
jgi:hypothetical protein